MESIPHLGCLKCVPLKESLRDSAPPVVVVCRCWLWVVQVRLPECCYRIQTLVHFELVLTVTACGLCVQARPHLTTPINNNSQLLSGLVLTPVVAEFGFNAPYLSLALNVGLFVGAVVWGIGCDVWGRRWSFNITLFLTGVFGLASGGSGNFITLASLFAVCGFGVGGNLPVDSAVFLG